MINYEGRRFRATHHGPEGSVTTYHQDGDLLWADFAGDGVRRGSLSGRCADDGVLEFAYSMVLVDGRVVAGRCRSTPERLDDGRVRLHETWQRFAPYPATGVAVLEEVP